MAIQIPPDCLSSGLPIRLVGGLTSGSIYALIALGYTLVYGVLRLINFAHSEVFMFGTFGGLLSLNAISHHGAVTHAYYLLFGIIPAMAAAAFVAVSRTRLATRRPGAGGGVGTSPLYS